MKTKFRNMLAAGSAVVMFSTTALAQTTGVLSKSLGQALLYSLIFATVGIFVVFVAFKIFDLALTEIDVQKELLNNNIAVGLVTGAVIIGISIIVAVSIM